MQKNSLLTLFLIFVKIGAILLGGGYVILPILTNEFVEKRKLIEYEDLINYFAISQSLPGIIAANISMFIGYKLHGKTGALIGMLGIIFVPIIIIILLASIIGVFINNNILQNALWGIGIAVIALIILTIREFWQKTSKNAFFYIFFIITLLTLIFAKISPIKTILIFVPLGLLCKHFSVSKEAR